MTFTNLELEQGERRQNERHQDFTLTVSGEPFDLKVNNLNDEIKINNSELSFINDVSQLITTGKQTRRFQCETICAGLNHDLEADAIMALISEATSQNPGELLHPFFGTFPVLADGSIKRNTNLVDSIFITTITFNLVEITPLQQTESDLSDKIAAFDKANAEYFKNLEVTEVNKKSLLNKMKDIYDGYNKIMNKVNFYTQLALNTIRDANSAIKKGYYDIVLAPANIINTAKEVLNLGVQQTAKTLKEATDTYYENAFSNPLAKRPDESQNSAQFPITEYDDLDNSNNSLYDPNSQDFNETLINMNNMNTSLLLMCEAINKTTVKDYVTVTKLKDSIFNVCDEVKKQYEIMIDSYDLTKPIMDLTPLIDLKSAVQKQYDSLDLIKKKIYTIQKDCNFTQLMIELHGTYTDELYQTFINDNPDLNSVVFFNRGQQCLV